MPRRATRLTSLLRLLTVFAGGLLLGWSGVLPNPLTGQPRGFQPFWQAWRLVRDEYVDEKATDPGRLMRGAISGMLASLGDTGHTGYLTPEEARRLEESLAGELEGIGVRVSLRRRRPAIVAVLPGSPAQKAGLKAGDVLLRVDDHDLEDKSLDQVVELVVGKAGTEVRLQVAREGKPAPLDFRVTRARLDVPDVTWHMLPGRPVAHVAIHSFGDKAHEQLKKALEEARAAGARGLVLDVRGNSGGLKEQAVAVTSEFLKDGDVLLEQDRKGKRTPVPVRPSGTATDLPAVVLIDEGTASSAEIFAGALQDHGRAKLVGTRTFGTGTVLQEFKLSDGSVVLLAVAQWLTPSGRQIWHKGIVPDVAVALPEGANVLLPETLAGLDAAGLARADDKPLLKALEVLEGQMAAKP